MMRLSFKSSRLALAAVWLAAIWPGIPHASQPVYDAEAVARATDLINQTKTLTEGVANVKEKIEAQVEASGVARVIQLPLLDIERITTRAARDAQCLLPDVKNFLPRVEFKNIDVGSICNLNKNYKQALSFHPDSEEGRKMTRIERSNRRELIRSSRRHVLEESVFKSLAAGTAGLQAASDFGAAADTLAAQANAATNMNERLAVLNQGVVLLVRTQVQNNILLAQQLELTAAAAVWGLPTDAEAAPDGGRTNGGLR